MSATIPKDGMTETVLFAMRQDEECAMAVRDLSGPLSSLRVLENTSDQCLLALVSRSLTLIQASDLS